MNVTGALPVLSDFSQRVWTSYELVQGLREIGEGRPMGALFLPAIEHQLVDSLRTIHRRWKPVALLDRLYHILIRPIPVRPLAVRHHLPAYDTHAPNVGGAREFTERYRLRCCPPYRDFTALNINGRLSKKLWIHVRALYMLLALTLSRKSRNEANEKS